MRNIVALSLAAAVWLGALATVGTSAAPQAAAPLQAPAASAVSASSTPPAYQATVKQYCVTCHNERLKTGDLVLDKANLENVAADRAGLGKSHSEAAAGRDAASRHAAAG